MPSQKSGWFADIDPEAAEPYIWQATFQASYRCTSLDAWFPTEEECLEFIKEEILGQGLYDE